jgi:hypothetical protein
MANRLTDTTIWKKQKWFKKLNLEHKLVWKYLTDVCDHAGVWKVDLSELLEDLGMDEFNFDKFIICCNKDYDKKTGKGVIRQRIMQFNDDYVWITGFMSFQYGGKTQIINLENNAIISAIKILEAFNLFKLGIKLNYYKIKNENNNKYPLQAPSSPSKPLEAPQSPFKGLEALKDKEKDKEYKNISTENELTFKLSSLGEIKVLVLQCEDWAFKELKDFVQKSQQNFESVAMTNPLMNNAENFKIVIQQFVNMIQSTDDYQESSKLRKFFGNWVSKKNGSLQNFIDGYKNNLGGKKNKNSYI